MRSSVKSSSKSPKRSILAIIAWLTFIILTSLFFVYPMQSLMQSYHYSIVILQGVITAFVVTNFLLTTFMDPGRLPKVVSPDSIEDEPNSPLYKSITINGYSVPMKWCATCQIYRPPRCSHCSMCQHCIDVFDHHCPWVNNCIGQRNYRHFFFFLFFLCIHMSTVFAWCVLFILDNLDKLDHTEVIITIVILVFIAVLFFPIFLLMIIHVMLVARGRTTNELVTGKFSGGQNPFSKGCPKNCLWILCGPLATKYTHIGNVNAKKRQKFINGRCGQSVNDSNNVVARIYREEHIMLLRCNEQNGRKQPNSWSMYEPDERAFTPESAIVGSQSRDCEPSLPTSPRRNPSTDSLHSSASVGSNVSPIIVRKYDVGSVSNYKGHGVNGFNKFSNHFHSNDKMIDVNSSINYLSLNHNSVYYKDSNSGYESSKVLGDDPESGFGYVRKPQAFDMGSFAPTDFAITEGSPYRRRNLSSDADPIIFYSPESRVNVKETPPEICELKNPLIQCATSTGAVLSSDEEDIHEKDKLMPRSSETHFIKHPMSFMKAIESSENQCDTPHATTAAVEYTANISRTT